MTKSDDKRVPALRFKGFTDEWEQRKLENITKRISRKNSNLDSNLPLTISAQYGLVDQRDFFDKQIASKKLENYLLLKNGEFAYNKSYSKDYPFGAIKRLNNYKSGVLSTLYIAFKPVSINTDYLEEYFDSTKWYKEIYKRATEGARNHGLLNISPQDFFELNLSIPNNIIEQERISKILKSLSLLITLQQRKLKQLELLKNSMLQKLFTDKDNPQLRFKGFTDNWGQRKLGDTVTSIIAGGDIDKSKILKNGRYPVYGNALTNDGVVGYYEGQYRVKAPAVTVTGRGEIGIAKARNRNFTPVVRLLAINSSHNNYFLANMISTHKIFIESTGVPQLTVPQLSNYKMRFPNNLEEENQIGVFFQQMDSLITLQQKKLKKSQYLKQFLLQNMFI